MVALHATIPGKNTLEERLFYCQNWRHDVVMLLDSAGGRAEGVRYSAYGVPFGIPRADVTGDGSVGTADTNVVAVAFGSGVGDPGYNIRADINLDGEVDLGDSNILSVDFGATLGRGSLSSYTTSGGGGGGVRNRIGYAGYQFDDAASKYHVRNRVYDAVSGRWLRRDPLGYVDGPGLYEYARGMPVVFFDPQGTFICTPGIILKGCIGLIAHNPPAMAVVALLGLGITVYMLIDSIIDDVNDPMTVCELGIDGCIRHAESQANACMSFCASVYPPLQGTSNCDMSNNNYRGRMKDLCISSCLSAANHYQEYVCRQDCGSLPPNYQNPFERTYRNHPYADPCGE